jgi:coproporphyrinogen III oxidase-like Fe-S oxidoreductase
MRYALIRLIAAWAAAAGFVSVNLDFMYSLIW